MKATGLSEAELVKLDLYFTSVLHKLARSIAHALHIHTRQQVIATSLIYFKRFFVKNGLESIDPLLVCAGCFYLASKVEECPVHIKSVVNEMRHLFGTSFPYDAQAVSEFEFLLLEDLDFYTIVYHPYRPLNHFITHLKLEKSFTQTSFFILNDTYRTDLCLLQPPHIIALTALYVTSVIHKTESYETIRNFFKSLNGVDMVVVVECAQIIFNLYAVWAGYSETQVLPLLVTLNNHKCAFTRD